MGTLQEMAMDWRKKRSRRILRSPVGMFPALRFDEIWEGNEYDVREAPRKWYNNTWPSYEIMCLAGWLIMDPYPRAKS